LRLLDLGGNVIGPSGVEALARSRSLPNLRYLDLSNNDIQDGTAVARLIASRTLASLTVLRLDSNLFRGLDPAPLRGKTRPPGLRVLTLNENAVGIDGLEALAGCPACRGLWVLNLENCGLTVGAVRKFVAAADWDGLVWLNLSENKLNAAAAAALADWPGAATLRGLELVYNPLTRAGGEAIA